MRKKANCHLDGSSPTLENFTVKHSAWAAISALPTDAPVITNFAAEDVVLAGMEMRGGALTTSTTWNQVGIVYLLTNDFTIGNGATLTIAPGVIVKLLYGCCSFNKQSLQVEGALTVSGSPSQKVYFTSTRDDAIGGGYTNNDAGGSQPQAGDWETIQFLAGSQDNFAHAVIRYGGISRTTGALHIKGATVTITNSVISNNFIGLLAEGATAEVQAQMSNIATSVSKSGLYSNAEYDVFAKNGASVVADNNWWGSSNPQPKVSGNVTTANPCADEACTTIRRPSGLYLPLVRR